MKKSAKKTEIKIESAPTIPPTRARGKSKIPKILPAPDGSLTHLTHKQRGIIRRLPTADTLMDIADQMNCSEGLVRKTFKLPAVQEYIKKGLDAAGATHGKIWQRIAEGLDATSRKDGFTKDGRIVKGEERPDYTERRESARLALRLQGMDQTPDPEAANNVTSQSIYNIIINARTARQLDPAPVQDVQPEPPAAPITGANAAQTPPAPAAEVLPTDIVKEEKP